MNSSSRILKDSGLKESTISRINSVFSHYPQIRQVLLYGSRAKGTFRNGSDIDLSIVGILPHSEQLRLENELDELLLPYKIDLSQYHQIGSADLIDHIRRVGVVFYDSESQ